MSVTEIPATDERDVSLTPELTASTADTPDNVPADTNTSPSDSAKAQRATEDTTTAIAPRAATGFLTLTPDQNRLTDDQRAAFSSLGVDPGDPAVVPHVRRFVHICQMWGVDPWSGEIYLVQRGKAPQHPGAEDKRTWTVQVGINGYRRRAREVSFAPDSRLRWIGKARWYWTGGDDDPNSWKPVEDPETGDIIMRAVWWEVWPDSRPAPAAAKAVITVEDTVTGERRTEEFVAHWEMFAAYEDVWEDGPNGRRKAFNPDGTPKRKLSNFWGRGKAHMLAKCAEASVLRATFHGAYHHPKHGTVYTAEEMSRADSDAARELEDAVNRRRREAFRQAQEGAREIVAEVGASGPVADRIREAARQAAAETARPAVVPGQVESEPVPVGDVLGEALPDVPVTGEERLRLLGEEIDWISDLLEQNVRNAIVRRATRNIDDMDADELLRWVGPLRGSLVIPKLRALGRSDEADAYAAFGPHAVAPVDVLTGRADLGGAPEGAQAHGFNPREDDDSRCRLCGDFEDDPVHDREAHS